MSNTKEINKDMDHGNAARSPNSNPEQQQQGQTLKQPQMKSGEKQPQGPAGAKTGNR